jgi:hypothetical protein
VPIIFVWSPFAATDGGMADPVEQAGMGTQREPVEPGRILDNGDADPHHV